jgi:hypothetical protein
MSIQVFNDAIQAARQAVIDRNQAAFDSALMWAHGVSLDVPLVSIHLQQARESYPELVSLRALTQASIVVAEMSS